MYGPLSDHMCFVSSLTLSDHMCFVSSLHYVWILSDHMCFVSSHIKRPYIICVL